MKEVGSMKSRELFIDVFILGDMQTLAFRFFLCAEAKVGAVSLLLTFPIVYFTGEL